ncbi:MAG: LysR family transcriptional regulator [Planctomycetaceae bacterium]|nr:LysR family transcriptional regulator [Planctomycetaceae bacterium]
MLHKVVTAGGEFASFQRASKMLRVLAEVHLSGMQVSRLTEEVGNELVAARDEQAEKHRRRELASEAQTPVPIAGVQPEGGRLHTRAPNSPRGVHEPEWKETKVACLWRMEGATIAEDPHPELPQCFRNAEHVHRLVREIKNVSSPHPDRPESSPGSRSRKRPRRAASSRNRVWPPKRTFRTAVATLRDIHQFGPLVAAEAQRRGFYEAGRQVFLGDGDHKNWTLHKTHFPHFTPVTDFVHVTAYVYQAAGAVTNSFAAQWEQYVTWLTDCWQGRVANVLEQLRDWSLRLGRPENPQTVDEQSPSEQADTQNESDPATIVAKVITYLRNNQERMNYPAYRQQGLPVTSCLVESLIKQFNQRVKGSETFWSRPDHAEAILQVRAALLSDDDRLTRHIRARPGRAVRRRPQNADHQQCGTKAVMDPPGLVQRAEL